MREKDLGIWRAITWREYGERAQARSASAWSRSGCSRGDVVSILADTCRSGSTPTWACCAPAASPTASTRPTRPAQVEYIVNDSGTRFLFVENEEQLDKILEVRERCPRPAQDRRLRHGGPARLQRPAGDVASTSCSSSAASYDDGASRGLWSSCVAASQARRPGDPRLHLGHDRPAQGRDAHPPQHRASSCGYADAFIPLGEGDEQLVLPAAVPHRRAHLHASSCRCTPAPSSTSPRASRRCRRTCARSRPTHVLRGAAHLGEVLFRRRHPHEGGDLARPRSPTAGRIGIGLQGGRAPSSTGRKPVAAL